MIWRPLGDPDYAVDIPAFVEALKRLGGTVRSVGLNQTEFEVATEAARLGVVRVDGTGTAEQTFALVVSDVGVTGVESVGGDERHAVENAG